MKKSAHNKPNVFNGLFLALILIVMLLSSCNPTKYVPQNETLLEDNKVEINTEGIKKSALVPYLRQTPNKRIFGTRFYLGLYNLSNINKTKWPHKWLREIGEPPVIYDSLSTVKSKSQIQSYIESKGYFDGTVTDSVETEKRRSTVYYDVHLTKPYTIRNIHYEIADTNIRKLFYFDSVDCVIERGKPYDVDILQTERSRFERYIKDRGFYSFSADNIFFRVDSTVGKRQVDIYYVIRNLPVANPNGTISYVPYPMYNVSNIYIYPDYVPKEALEGGRQYLSTLDTTEYRGYYFVSSEPKPSIKYDLIIQNLYLKPGTSYNITNTEQSQAHLLSLKVYRLVNILYNDTLSSVTSPGMTRFLNCNIQLTMLNQQSYRVELEGTNSAGNLGGALNLVYQHKNLFREADLFSMTLKGAYEAYSQKNSKLNSTEEYGVETSLRLPRFLLPFLEKESFIRKYNPSTTILGAFDYQKMPFYTRTMATATFRYDWKAGRYQEHIVSPLEMNLVKLQSIDSAFQASIDKSLYLSNSYKDVMILGGGYSYIFNNQKINKSKDFWFLRINAEAAGNLFATGAKLLGYSRTDSTFYKAFRQPFAQYVKAEIDVRYNYRFNDLSSIVYRGFAGAGIPYGNSKAMPFEKQYFGGGANDIRAWQVRSLGPGSYQAPDTVNSLYNETADIKLELNAEYRFKLFWILEGALFVDAGNIWTYKQDLSRPGAQFRFNKFYRDIAIGTGTGLRFDFSFVIARVDFGMKLRDPSISNGSRWIFLNGPYTLKNDFTVVLGIGYPF
ncbi:MAG TPA: BamA/TamA family outer membrane protein [Bacteroidales bacterium]|nr:BamA/TamA family outer membrane protein [Bacteroidales bacterium]